MAWVLPKHVYNKEICRLLEVSETVHIWNTIFIGELTSEIFVRGALKYTPAVKIKWATDYFTVYKLLR